MNDKVTPPAAQPQPQEDPTAVRMKALLDNLWKDGKLGSEVRAKAKELFPDIKIPEDEINPALEPMQAQIAEMAETNKKLLERLDAREKADKDARDEADLSVKLANAKARFNLTDDGLDKAIARMKETGNYTDPEAAAAWVASMAPPPPAAGPSWSPQRMNLFGSAQQDERWAQLHKDPEGYLDAELRRFVSDPDGYTREALAA